MYQFKQANWCVSFRMIVLQEWLCLGSNVNYWMLTENFAYDVPADVFAIDIQVGVVKLAWGFD